MGNFKEDIVKTEAFIFDVDGVMTDGGIMPLVDGDFIRKYYAKDGYAIAYALRMGYKVCIITGGRGATLDHRLKMLGITDVYLDCMDKISAMQDFFARHGLDPAHVIYMGDDIPDLPAMAVAGLSVAPRDAAREVLDRAVYISPVDGGYGVARDLLEQILKARGQWLSDEHAFGW